MSELITVSGLAETEKFLESFADKIVRDAFPESLAAGAGVMEAELIARTPRSTVETASAKRYGSLVADIATTIEVDEGSRVGSARVGFSENGFPARMVEWGHTQVSSAGEVIGHVAAHPFIRPAADASADGAEEAFTQSLRENLK